jgi:hypothetical protein
VRKLGLFVAVASLSLWSAAGNAEDRSIRVCNDASSRIIHVYATHVDTDEWGRDLLVGNIQPGDCRTIDPGPSSGYCLLDWRAELADGRYAEKRHVNACELETWTVYD